MIYWIHCNKCFELFCWKQKQFILLSCFHIFCESCLKSVNYNGYDCYFCKKQAGRKLINSKMLPKYKNLFHPRPWEDLKTFSTTIEFQSKHRNHLLQAISKAEIELQFIRNEKEKLKMNLKGQLEKRNELRNKRERLEKFIQSRLLRHSRVRAIFENSL